MIDLDVLLYVVSRYIDYRTYKNIKYLCSDVYNNKKKMNVKLRHGIRERLSEIGINPDDMDNFLTETNAVMTGSFPLQVKLGVYWENSDIDIYLPSILSFKKFKKYFPNDEVIIEQSLNSDRMKGYEDNVLVYKTYSRQLSGFYTGISNDDPNHRNRYLKNTMKYLGDPEENIKTVMDIYNKDFNKKAEDEYKSHYSSTMINHFKHNKKYEEITHSLGYDEDYDYKLIRDNSDTKFAVGTSTAYKTPMDGTIFAYLAHTSIIGVYNYRVNGIDIQLISYNSTLDEIMDSFDFDICKMIYNGKNVKNQNLVKNPLILSKKYIYNKNLTEIQRYNIRYSRLSKENDIKEENILRWLKIADRVDKYRKRGFKIIVN
jgi:hypothetical protein